MTQASSFGSESIYPSISHDGRPASNRRNVLRRDCNSTSLALLNRRPGGDRTWSLSPINSL